MAALGHPERRPSVHTRLMYARGSAVHLDTALFQVKGSHVTMLSGLPASGKDSWVARHAQGMEIVSFDDAKAELGPEARRERWLGSASRSRQGEGAAAPDTSPSYGTRLT